MKESRTKEEKRLVLISIKEYKRLSYKVTRLSLFFAMLMTYLTMIFFEVNDFRIFGNIIADILAIFYFQISLGFILHTIGMRNRLNAAVKAGSQKN